MAWMPDAVYWMNHAQDGWLAVQLVEQRGDVVTVKTREDEHYDVPANPPLKAALPSSLIGYANLLSLGELHEGAILHTLRTRYAQDAIYTNISNIVLSINPYKEILCYGPSQIALFRSLLLKGVQMQDAAPPAGTGCMAVANTPLPPHVYALADSAYGSLQRDGLNQAVIISGESGAGKTEATKLVLQFIAEVSGQNADIAQQILEANPIMEMIGNAKTVRNNNSSRFGKWCEIHFDPVSLRIRGAAVTSFLLEKSRVVHQAHNERNYHVFYALVAGATAAERAALFLSPSGASAYRLLTGGECLTVPGLNDAEDWAAMRKAMDTLRFSAEDVQETMRMVAAVLHIGNIEFDAEDASGAPVAAAAAGPASPSSASSAANDGGKCSVSNGATTLAHACSLLQLDVDQCARALTSRQLRIAGGEVITVFNSATVCADNRDALAKALYEALFLRLLHHINATLQLHSPAKPRIIGVLDIFGFEDFRDSGNYFEQLCINYANEKLQSHFTAHVFALEQREYARENIDVSAISFVDNAPCLQLIEERRSGILDMIVEEIRLPKGSDLNLLQRMHDAFAPTAPGTGSAPPTYAKPAHAFYVKPKTRESTFSIRHFAGDVSYRIDHFLEKNKDSIPEALRECVESSTAPDVAKIFNYKRDAALLQATKHAAAAESAGRMSVDGGPMSPLSPSSPPASVSGAFPPRSSGSHGHSNSTLGSASQSLTLGAQFRSQLADLMATLNSCRANFVRCLKPNAEKVADNFDSAFVLKQLQYLGIREVIAIRQQGYPVRIRHAEFLQRYALLLPDAKEAQAAIKPGADVKAAVKRVFDTMKVQEKDWRMGTTQVFFRNSCHAVLEAARDARFVAVVVKLQALQRGKQQRRRFQRMKLCSRRLVLAVAHAEKANAASLNLSSVATTPKAAGGLGDSPAWATELDAAIAEAVEAVLPTWRVTAAREVRKRSVEVFMARRGLALACQCKDVQLLRTAIAKATEHKLDAATVELVEASALLERLLAYATALKAAVEARSIESLQSVLAEAAALSLDSSAEQDAHALLRRLLEERACESKLEELCAARGPLSALTEALSAAELLGLSGSTRKSPAVAKAQALAGLLMREAAALKSLANASAARDLSSLDAAIAAITGDDSLAALHQHEALQAAQKLKGELTAAAAATECADHLRSAIAARNAQFIENTLAAFRALAPEALAALGAGASASLISEAEVMLDALRTRIVVVQRLQQALDARSLPALQSALEFAAAQAAACHVHDLPEHVAAMKMQSAFSSVVASLEKATASQQLAALQLGLEEAAKLGLEPEASPSVAAALAARAQLQRMGEVRSLLRSALSASDEGMLNLALERAREAGLGPEVQEVADAEAALGAIQLAARKQQQAAADAVRAMEAERERAAAEAAAAVAASEAAAAASAAAQAAAAAGKSASAVASARAKHFQADVYRAAHFQLSLFPLLRSGEDFARGKMFGKDKLAAAMLSWSKEPLPRSLCRLEGPGADELSVQACNLFRAVQGFMGDRAYSFSDGLGCEVLAAGVATPELRDEIYLQLAKQLQGNPGEDSVRKGWQLLGLACESFAPSDSLRPFLYHFLLAFHDDPVYSAHNYVAFALRTLQQHVAGSFAISHAPTIAHVSAFRERVMQSAEVRVHWADGSSYCLLIDPSISAASAVEQLLERAGLPVALATTFALFHQAGPLREPMQLPGTACPLDYAAAQAGPADSSGCRFLLQKRIWCSTLAEESWSGPVLPAQIQQASGGAVDWSSVDVSSLGETDLLYTSLLFHQLLSDLLRFEHYDLSPEEMVHAQAVLRRVVASKLLPLVGEEHGTAVAEQRDLSPTVALTWSGDDLAAFEKSVGAQLAGMGAAASYSPLVLLDKHMRARAHFGYRPFPVHNPELAALPPSLLVGVGLAGIFLLDATTRQLLKHFKYPHITGWAANTIKFSLRVLIAKGKTQQLNFAATEGKRITATIEEVVAFIVAKNKAKQAAAAQAQ